MARRAIEVGIWKGLVDCTGKERGERMDGIIFFCP